MKHFSKIRLLLLTLCLAFCFSLSGLAEEVESVSTPAPAPTAAPVPTEAPVPTVAPTINSKIPTQFVKRGAYYTYSKAGKQVKKAFVTLNSKTYYFDSKGRLKLSSMFKKGKYTYYADESGVIAKNCFVTINNKRYFFNTKGIRKTGWIDYKGHTYYCPSSGKIYRNQWAKIGKYYYYFSSSYYIRKNNWIDEKYYVDSKGRRVISPTTKNGKKNKIIAIKNIKQNPELPTGCESVALTIVLNHYGFNLSKTTIASKYLPKSGSNFVTAFWGDPFSYSGGGIYSPGLTTTANKFLKDKKSKLHATDLTGKSFTSLYQYIDAGIPVIVWNTMYMRTPHAVYSMSYKGKSWTFYQSEHCVVLCGYSADKKKVLINDPLSGLVWRKTSTFKSYYDKLGKMAIVLQ